MPFAAYLADIAAAVQLQNAAEYTFRPALKTLIQSVAPETARQLCGTPDCLLTKKFCPLGNVETKPPGTDLNNPEFKEQFDRCKAALPNLIITDYIKFQFCRNGTKIAEIDIAEFKEGKIKPLRENFEEFRLLLKNFCEFTGETVSSAAELARLLANKAQLLTNAVRNALNEEEKDDDENQSLQEQLKAFKKVLIPDISSGTFADIYAQTITYGMFAGRLHHQSPQPFSRQNAAECVPQSHPFLRSLFSYIAGPAIDERIRRTVDELAALLQAANMKAVMEDFGKATKTEDAVIHFYENFLTAYNPNLRKNRGVYYTPLPAVRYIVQAVDDILKQEFGLADREKTEIGGKKMHRVQILDPAAGTGTFFAETVRQIHGHIVSKNQQGMWNSYVADDLLPRLHGFEILTAPYAIAHLKLDMILENTGYEFKKNQHVSIYLMNSLDGGINKATYLSGFIARLIKEAQGAKQMKHDAPIMVVLGNPPYNVSSMNKNKFSEALLESYKADLAETNIQPLSDDYIKFIALGQHYIEKNPSGGGILAYISNNSFLDGVTHRNMRRSLLAAFDKIYILNLHGNVRKKETAPDGGKDENIFNIMQGTSINIFIRSPKHQTKKSGRVFYADLYGKRSEKYRFLESHCIKKTGFTSIEPVEPYYFFVPKDFSLQKKYEKGFSIEELFLTGNSGVETKRDSLFIDNDRDVLIKRIKKLLTGNYNRQFEETYRIADTNGYEITRLLKGKKYNPACIRPISYCPFDIKWIYYDPALIARHFYSTMQHFLGKENTGLIAKRGFDSALAAPAFVSQHLIDRRAWSCPGMQGAERIFPLYLYDEFGGRHTNLSQDIAAKIEAKAGRSVKPLQIFDYVYGVLYHTKYRSTYQEFLKIDFPGIPYPKNAAEFDFFVKTGGRLRKLHLMESVPKIKTSFPASGSGSAEKIIFKNGRVYINPVQYFGNVPESAWNSYIGGYQPAQKYLKDRKGRTLSAEEIIHYQKIIAVLEETEKIASLNRE